MKYHFKTNQKYCTLPLYSKTENMDNSKMLKYIKEVLDNMPSDWLNLTTHRLDIYNEKLAKTQFIDQFEVLYNDDNSESSALKILPTAYDYIRLGHPLSCILEWAIAKTSDLKTENVISFSSQTIPVMAILRKNLLDNRATRIIYTNDDLANFLKVELLREVYSYNFELVKVDNITEIPKYDGSTVIIDQQDSITIGNLNASIDFHIKLYPSIGSILIINGEHNDDYVSDIQHVRRRETIAMTPANCLIALRSMIEQSPIEIKISNKETNKSLVSKSIKEITGTSIEPIVGSSGLSIQYAIMMGLIHDAQENHPGKDIKIIVPPNCYGGTNDQARRVAACIDNVEIMDLPVDGDNDMVQSVDLVLSKIADEDAVPYIIAEIPTNPRVEVPDLIQLREALSKKRKNKNGQVAIDPVFILDQTFCPNVQFLGEGEILSTVRTVSYASGSKFPSGGRCTAGYCVGNKMTGALMQKIDMHIKLCDNEATDLQMQILAEQMPSMLQRIQDAYKNTRKFVNFIHDTLPEAKINFVSEDIAQQGFTPSVFSLDLPTQGDTDEERESYKRALNHKLINLMITEIPDESKYCVSYGQLKGCYWTIPATSTQGTTKEGDKDYIARVALSADMDLDRHKKVFLDFVNTI